MSNWKRMTQEVPFENLPPDMINEIKQHIEKYNLGQIVSDGLMCIRTDSEKMKKSLFGGVRAYILAHL